ncbi:hypothetical protein EGM88_11715 [Aureibaculum marinum]|uniref:Uncharacterized protein n=1 Tax=Aureibaculum marinum TaxID=2487930 RepID=A0A3N4NN02_9FLAO|nr:hypothetical protein EGM88_11715 [Aureibaculum marinum]
MILLISSEYDTTTNIVANWLVKLKVKFKRLNFENQHNLNWFLINNKESCLKINGFDFSNVKVVWHRRGRLRHVPVSLNNAGNLYN